MADFNTDVNITPDRNLKHTTKPRVLKAKYGDGYEQRAGDGINTLEESWDLVWSNRTLAESNKILKFLEDQGGYSAFDWYPPGYEISSSATSTTADKLVDSTQYFTTRYLNATITNTTDSPDTTATITAIDSGTTLSLSSDIMESGDSYLIEPSLKYVCEEWNASMPQDGYQTVTAKFRRVFEP